MLPASPRLGLALLVLAAACRIEDHTPAGTRRDEALIQGTVQAFYHAFNNREWVVCDWLFTPDAVLVVQGVDATGARRSRLRPAGGLLPRLAAEGRAPAFRYALVRNEVRQAEGYAEVWVHVRRTVPGAAEPGLEEVERLVLLRDGPRWRIALLAAHWAGDG